MTDADYIFLILNGYVNHYIYLSDYFYREYKEAEKKYIKAVEYFERLNNANDYFFNEIQKQYYERLNELSILKSISENEGKPIKELDDETPKLAHFSVHLFSLTGGKFVGHLWLEDLSYIRQELIKAIEKVKIEITPNETNGKIEDDKKKLRVKQIALIHFYEGRQITRKNATEIAEKYGYTSGEGLFQDYTYFIDNSNRRGKPLPCTPKKLKNKIDLFKSVIQHLSDKSIKKAATDIMVLEEIYENEFG